jgi:hypothetical protein
MTNNLFKNRFLISLREGDRAGFFSLWDTHFPPDVRQTDSLYQKLEFQVWQFIHSLFFLEARMPQTHS